MQRPSHAEVRYRKSRDFDNANFAMERVIRIGAYLWLPAYLLDCTRDPLRQVCREGVGGR